MDPVKSDDIIKDILRKKCEKLESRLRGEVITIRAPMQLGIDDAIRREIEKLASCDKYRNQLVVILETMGGYIEVVERVNHVFRHHFERVVFVIPNFAYSAGTVLVLSGDDIFMDYYSVLGPIDPQIEYRGSWVPGLGYLDKYEELINKDVNAAELEFLVRKFDPAQLFALEQAKKHSAGLIEKWLSDYKFKDWNKTESSGREVTPEDRRKRAREIAMLLGDPKVWQSHGRGIPRSVLVSERVKLKIEDFGADPELNREIREYYDLFMDHLTKIDEHIAIHTKHRLWTLGGKE